MAFILIRQGRRQHARDAFSEAVAHAESQLQCATTNFTALDTKALALCGLAVLGDGFRLDRQQELSGQREGSPMPPAS